MPRPRIAFLFLVRDRLLNPGVWRRFFAGREAECDLHIHSKRPFRGADFARHALPDPAPTRWGWLLGAELRLLRRALENPAADRFLLLSESCLPLRGFGAVAEALRGDGRSWIDVRPERNPERRPPDFPAESFRKQSQWMALTRPHAELMARDGTVAPLFLNAPIADEHYPISLLAALGRLGEVADRPPTYVDWTTAPGAGRPRTFPRALVDADRRALSGARAAGTLFARKFPAGCDTAWLESWLERN